MSILTIRQEPDPILRKVAESCNPCSPEIRQLAKDMLETLHSAAGMGLAAPQIGQSVRLIVVVDRAFANPGFNRSGRTVQSIEGCLSVPGRGGRVMRNYKMWMHYQDIATGQHRCEKFRGLIAACLQHEIDHLDGILFIDKLEK